MFVLILSLTPFIIFSQNRIAIPSKSIERGKIDTITITGTLLLRNSASLRIKLLFDAHFIDIKKVIGNPEFAITEVEPEFNIDLTKIDSAVLNVQSSKFQSVTNGTIFQVLLEGLVYQDSITYIYPIEVALDDSLLETQKDPGRIIIQGPTVIPISVTSIGFAYPSPVQSPLKFNFTLSKQTRLHFALFSINGKQILSSTNNPGNFTVLKGSTNVSLNETFATGSYILQIEIPNEISSGVYFLRMDTTEFGPFYSKFMLLK
ncbi:MAG: hypothetical protein ACUVQ1_05730 [Candidatus Kapaibacteriales bacterium]